MNMTQFRVVIQYLATALAAYVAGRGWLPQDVATELATWLVGALPVAYSVWKSRNQGKIETAAQVPGVTIVAPDTIAEKAPAANVVPASEHRVVSK